MQELRGCKDNIKRVEMQDFRGCKMRLGKYRCKTLCDAICIILENYRCKTLGNARLYLESIDARLYVMQYVWY